MDAEIFAHPIGFIPRFPPPPKYIKVRSHFKKDKDFDRVFVAQELRGAGAPSSQAPPASPTAQDSSTEKAIWALEFSNDGKYLAAAGQDKIVRVWAVLATAEDRQAHEREEDAGSEDKQHAVRLSAPVFKSKPIREYDEHKSSVLDLSWSKVSVVQSFTKPSLGLIRRVRTISFYPPPWIKRSDCGTSAEASVSAVSNIATS